MRPAGRPRSSASTADDRVGRAGCRKRTRAAARSALGGPLRSHAQAPAQNPASPERSSSSISPSSVAAQAWATTRRHCCRDQLSAACVLSDSGSLEQRSGQLQSSALIPSCVALRGSTRSYPVGAGLVSATWTSGELPHSGPQGSGLGRRLPRPARSAPFQDGTDHPPTLPFPNSRHAGAEATLVPKVRHKSRGSHAFHRGFHEVSQSSRESLRDPAADVGGAQNDEFHACPVTPTRFRARRGCRGCTCAGR